MFFTIAFDVIIVLFLSASGESVIISFALGLFSGHVGLVCCWLLFGKQVWVFRAFTFSVPLGAFIWFVIALDSPNGKEVHISRAIRQGLVIIGVPMLCMLFAIAALRFFGISPRRPPSIQAARNEMRFSVRRIFGWTTFVAVVVSPVSWIGRKRFYPIFRDFEFPIIMGNMILITVGCVMFCWGVKRIWVAIPLSIASSIAFSVGACSLINVFTVSRNGWGSTENPILFIIASVTQAIFLTAWLSTWRVTARTLRDVKSVS